MKNILFVCSFLCFIACNNPALNEELQKAKSQLVETKAALEACSTPATGQLAHIVLFKLTSPEAKDSVFALLRPLEDIEEVQSLELGSFEEVGDPRAISGYEIIARMHFKNEEAYRTYQEHPIHVDAREKASKFFAAPPATYDYLVD